MLIILSGCSKEETLTISSSNDIDEDIEELKKSNEIIDDLILREILYRSDGTIQTEWKRTYSRRLSWINQLMKFENKNTDSRDSFEGSLHNINYLIIAKISMSN